MARGADAAAMLYVRYSLYTGFLMLADLITHIEINVLCFSEPILNSSLKLPVISVCEMVKVSRGDRQIRATDKVSGYVRLKVGSSGTDDR